MMKSGKSKGRWQFYLILAGLVIVVVSTIYTKYLTDKIAQSEKKKVELFAETISIVLSDPELTKDMKYQQSVLELVNDVPVILVDERGDISMSNNFGQNANLEKELEKIKKRGYPPIQGHGYASEIYFKHTHLLSLLTYFPFVQLLLILSFMTIGFVSLRDARIAEQNKVWVGLAKETAHQLGTPISGIMAWIEHLKEINDDNPEELDILNELNKDVGKLDLIADRFSKIGSTPKLESIDLIPVVEEVKAYIQRRASNHIAFVFEHADPKVFARVNKPLFTWVVENLLRNSVDAIEGGRGEIVLRLDQDSKGVYLGVMDTGKGIPSGKHKSIFSPGYTTKTRGWGLGLSLAKRIIVDYHAGKIYVKRSAPDEGTTIMIELPKT